MSIGLVAKKDLRDTSRSRTLWGVVLLFVLFTAGIAYLYTVIAQFQTGNTDALQSIGLISFLGTPIGLFVPIIGLLLGYKAIVGEVESGSIKLLLSEPHSRSDVVLGKYLGRSIALGIATLIGFAVALVVVLVFYSEFSPVIYLQYVLLTLLFGAAYVSIGIAVSSLTRSSSMAIAGVVGLFVLLNMLWGVVLNLLHWQIEGSFFVMTPVPDWYRFAQQLSPNGAFNRVVNAMIDLPGASQQFMVGTGDPWFVQWYAAVVVLLLWVVVPLGVGYLRFRSMDL